MDDIQKPQSGLDFGGSHKNFEAVIAKDANLWHWWRRQFRSGAAVAKKEGAIASDRQDCSFPSSIIQSNSRSGCHGTFVRGLVPVVAAGQCRTVDFCHITLMSTNPVIRASASRTGSRVTGPAFHHPDYFSAGGPREFRGSPCRSSSNQGPLRISDSTGTTILMSTALRSGPANQRSITHVCRWRLFDPEQFWRGAHRTFESGAFVRLPTGREVLHILAAQF